MKHFRCWLLLALILSVPAVISPKTQAADGEGKPESKAQTDKKTGKKVKDPVCGMEMDPESAAGKANYKGKTYYFCSVNEKEQFEKEPAKYVK
jgi:YHS domain-containing protein